MLQLLGLRTTHTTALHSATESPCTQTRQAAEPQTARDGHHSWLQTCSASFALSAAISAFSFSTCSLSSFFVACTGMAFARSAYLQPQGRVREQHITGHRHRARVANLRVVNVSAKLDAAGLRVASMQVRLLPPSDSCEHSNHPHTSGTPDNAAAPGCSSPAQTCRTRVNLEFRYGMNTFFLPLPSARPSSASLLMTCGRRQERGGCEPEQPRRG